MTSRCISLLLLVAACGADTSTERTPASPDAGDSDPSPSTTEPDAGVDACAQAKSRSDFAFIQQHVLTPTCATAMCHSGPEPEVGLDLSAGVAYANLVNKGSSTQTGWTRVTPGSLANSYLAVSLGRAEGPPPRDGYMPLGSDPLCLEKLEAIERWILAGAQP